LQAQDSILLAANKVTNELGLIDASRGSTAIVSDTDIINRSGMISGNSVLLNAARDIQIDAVTRQFNASRQTIAGNVSGSNTEVGPQGSVVSRGDLAINAGRDIKLAGALVPRRSLLKPISTGRAISASSLPMPCRSARKPA
jgi:adhesin HecA-like repeat protein